MEPALTNQGWRFGDHPESNRHEPNGATYLHEIYTKADPAISGRAMVPVLWDKQRQTITKVRSSSVYRNWISFRNAPDSDLSDRSRTYLISTLNR
ncbi:hypothetical protein [Microvirga makkahensis]|uniref:hypothetical protein n=1 Tax=Microvirga makkahensis TaxID=1128670 RepID=UPI003CCCA755